MSQPVLTLAVYLSVTACLFQAKGKPGGAEEDGEADEEDRRERTIVDDLSRCPT